MSKGVILFAFNTDTVDYVGIAEQAARLIRHSIDLPVTLVTDKEIISKYVDQVVYTENVFQNKRQGYAGGTPWRNGNRYYAYELSPYNETILLDSDYLVLDQSLLTTLDTTSDYRIVHHNHNLNSNMTGNMGVLSLDYVWATVVTFKRTPRAKMLFDLVGRIQRNYAYYRQLYQIRERNYRNDYAFAIANNIVSGYTPDVSQSIVRPMLTLDQKIELIELNGHQLIIRETERAHILPRQNIHIMDKDYLLSKHHVKFVDSVCKE